MADLGKRNVGISIHALLAESDQSKGSVSMSKYLFLSTLSLRRATLSYYFRKYLFLISIHALLAESDRMCSQPETRPAQFLSTLSLRRATRPYYPQSRPLLFLSTLSLRRATIHTGKDVRRYSYFYPRSPCGERPNDGTTKAQDEYISIHALLAESDFLTRTTRTTCGAFLSTLSLRRATLSGQILIC